MSVLDAIITSKLEEVAKAKKLVPQSEFINYEYWQRNTASLSTRLKNSKFGLISEFKRRSPSKGIINNQVEVINVAKGYQEAGAAAISVLTDEKYFSGTLADLKSARTVTTLPILRKDFMIDSYQIHEAKAYGADIILLIAKALTPNQISDLSICAKELGLEVLLEVHNLEELESAPLAKVDFIGVNNRNLSTFDTTIETSKALADLIPSDKLKISESGLNSHLEILELIRFGYQGFLIGEGFMKELDPSKACAQLIKDVERCL